MVFALILACNGILLLYVMRNQEAHDVEPVLTKPSPAGLRARHLEITIMTTESKESSWIASISLARIEGRASRDWMLQADSTLIVSIDGLTGKEIDAEIHGEMSTKHGLRGLFPPKLSIRYRM